MSIRAITRYLLDCDECRDSAGSDDDRYTLYFDTHDAALTYAADSSWTVTDDGSICCPNCTLLQRCRHDQHTWSNWIPCRCRGRSHGHEITGCGLNRYCQVNNCTAWENTNLANLPTIDEPSLGC